MNWQDHLANKEDLKALEFRLLIKLIIILIVWTISTAGAIGCLINSTQSINSDQGD